MSECKYVRRIGQKWEFGIQRRTLCPVKKKEESTYEPHGTAQSYEEACLGGGVSLQGMSRHGFNHIDERGNVRCK